MAATACLLALYGAMNGPATRPATDAVFTTYPCDCCIRIGTNARNPWMTPHRLTPRTHSHVASGASHERPPAPTPALLHATWIAPKRSTAASASACTCAPSETSVTRPSTCAPDASSFATASASAGASMSPRTTFMPSAAKADASEKPIPLAPPVTTATRPSNSRTSVAVHVGFEGTLHRHAEGRRLLLGQRRERHAALVEVEARDLLVEVL